MSGKKNKEFRRTEESYTMDIRKLRFGLDVDSGRVMLGIPQEDGSINLNMNSVDVTEDFYDMVKIIMELRAAALEKQIQDQAAEATKPQIVLATDSDKRVLGLKG